MRVTRLTLLSIIYGLKEYLHNRGFSTDSGIASGFPYIVVQTRDQAYEDLKVPSVVVYPSGESDQELQLGGGYWIRVMVHFDIYGKTDGQMLDLLDHVREYIESPIYIQRYDLNTPSYQVSDGLVRTIYSDGAPTTITQCYFEDRSSMIFGRVDSIGESKAHTAQVTAVLFVPTS
jgi:hypothetical protein